MPSPSGSVSGTLIPPSAGIKPSNDVPSGGSPLTVTSNESVTVSTAGGVSAGGVSAGSPSSAPSWARAGAAIVSNTASIPIRIFKLFAKIAPFFSSELNEVERILSCRCRRCTTRRYAREGHSCNQLPPDDEAVGVVRQGASLQRDDALARHGFRNLRVLRSDYQRLHDPVGVSSPGGIFEGYLVAASQLVQSVEDEEGAGPEVAHAVPGDVGIRSWLPRKPGVGQVDGRVV